MGSIGAISFDRMELPTQPAKRKLLPIEPQFGVPGVGFMYDAVRGEPFPVRTLSLLASGAHGATKVAYINAIGTVVTMVDDFGISLSPVVVLDVMFVEEFPVFGATGVATGIWAAWTLVSAATS